jgi:hypothetical protein
MGNRGIRLRKGLWRFNIFAVALLSALLVGVPMLPYGLELPEPVLVPLVLIIVALFAAVSASWAGTFLAADQTRTSLSPVVGVSIGTAAVMALVVVQGSPLLSPAILAGLRSLILLAPMLLVALSASWAAWHFRSPSARMGREAMMTLALAVAVFCVALLPERLLGFSAMFNIVPENVQNFMFSHMLLGRVYVYILGVSVASWVSIVSVIVGVTLAMWRFRRRGDRLGMDAALTLGLVGLAPLIITGTFYFSYVL